MKNNGKMIYLAEIENLSYKEIAKVLNKSIGQVKIGIHRGKSKLQIKLMKEEIENV
jgi:DNA-directed RNA polymerase specialized sigma24 family protein